jgi:hypothetical protein
MIRANKTTKVKVEALFHRLQINKNLRFQTNILWKRRIRPPTQTKTKYKPDSSTTSTATPYINKFSPYNSTSPSTKPKASTKIKMYQSSHTDISRCDHLSRRQGEKWRIRKVQHRASDQQLLGRYHITHTGKLVTIPLSQCPDPNANVEVTFSYTFEEEGLSEVNR